jgi:transposase-like protein
VASNETAEDFQFLFQAVQSGVLEICSVNISNGFLACFPNSRVIMCWAHPKKNMETKARKFCKKQYLKQIFEDITKLNLAKSDAVFDKAAELFLSKWAKNVEFCAYFRKQWLDQNLFWYEGAGPGIPSTNNALESTNASIKREETFRERRGLGEFKVMLLEMAKK